MINFNKPVFFKLKILHLALLEPPKGFSEGSKLQPEEFSLKICHF